MNLDIKKIEKAENLRKKRFFSFLFPPNYYSSAELFIEIANEATTAEDKEKYYNQAANTFLMTKTKFGYFKAAEVYKMLMDLEIEHSDISKKANYCKLYGDNLALSEYYLIAGSGYQSAGEIYEKVDPYLAIECYKRGAYMFTKDEGYPYHRKQVNEKLLKLYLKIEDYINAIELLRTMNLNYSNLCIQILCVLGKQDIDDNKLESMEESRIVHSLINQGDENTIMIMKKFTEDRCLPDYVNMIFQASMRSLEPENNIC